MRTELWAIAAALVGTVLAAVGGLFLKWASGETRLSLRGFRLSRWLFVSVALYCASTVFFFIALLGAQLSTIVPLSALEYIWIAALARRYLGERLGRQTLVGIGLIVLGVVLVGLGS